MPHIDIRNLQSARMLRDIPVTFLVSYPAVFPSIGRRPLGLGPKYDTRKNLMSTSRDSLMIITKRAKYCASRF
jgi:hypothetical protein